jgi:signal transduction histidine kinase
MNRTFPLRLVLLAGLVVLIALPTSVGTAAWFIDAHRQQSDLDRRLADASSFIRLGAATFDEPAWQAAAKKRLRALDLAASLTLLTRKGKVPVFSSSNPPLKVRERQIVGGDPYAQGTLPPDKVAPAPETGHTMTYDFAVGRLAPNSQLVATISYRPLDRTSRALWSLLAGLIALVVGVTAGAWLLGHWLITPLRRLSAQVDRIAGGDLLAEPPRSPVAEVAIVAGGLAEMGAQMRSANERDAQLDRERRFFITAVAHDLRTPLFTLRGYLEALERGLPGHERYLPRARAKAAQLERLVGQLFSFSRAELMHERPRVDVVDLGSCLRSAAEAFETAAAERAIHISCTGPDRVLVRGDPDLLERVAANLVDNALRYADTSIEISWSAEDGDARFEIADDGPGIPAHALAHIFEPLFRGDPSRNTATGGAGLGLTIADKLMTLHGGSISVRNAPTGATFTGTLPLVAAAREKQADAVLTR